MKVIHCPSCGSGDIDESSFSAEYMSSTTYSCEDCNWSYKKGSGMGTGSGVRAKRDGGGIEEIVVNQNTIHSETPATAPVRCGLSGDFEVTRGANSYVLAEDGTMSSEIFEEIVEQRKDCINGDRVYLDNDSYFDLLSDDNMIRAKSHGSINRDSMRVAGLEVYEVPQLEQGVKDGRTQAIPLSFYYPNG